MKRNREKSSFQMQPKFTRFGPSDLLSIHLIRLFLNDEQRGVSLDCARLVAGHLGCSEIMAHQIVILPTFGSRVLGLDERYGKPILPRKLHPEAIRRFTSDLLKDKAEAHAVRIAREHFRGYAEHLYEVEVSEQGRISRETGFLGRSDETRALIEKTEVFRLALADTVLSGDEIPRALQTWARLYWPDDVAPVLRVIGGELKSANYNFQTAQESDWLLRAACDGERMTGYRKSPERGALIYEQDGASHRVELTQDAPESDGELLEMGALEWLSTQQSADFGFTFFYICRLIAPPAPLPSNRAAIGWIDLDDVAAKIGYDVDGCTAEKREELRAKIWQFLLFGSRALVIGQRKTYRDRATGENIETRVETPPWRILDKERPVQTAMFGETPRRVQLLISKEWEPLLTAPALAQYLPFAEIVGELPANQTGGAWARVLGMALASFWRRLPHEATGAAPAIQPTRRELLTRYTPKISLPLELLASKDPKRAVKYWRDALAMLRERGFIAPDGEAARTVADMLGPLPKYKWQEVWLDERVDLRPGPVEIDALRELASAKHNPLPRALGASKRRATRPKTPKE